MGKWGETDLHNCATRCTQTCIAHYGVSKDTNRNMASPAGIYLRGPFMFMIPLPGLSPLLNCVLTHFGSIMLFACGEESKCDRTRDCAASSPLCSGTFEQSIAHSSMSGLASHSTNDSFMTSVPSIRDRGTIKQHATPTRK